MTRNSAIPDHYRSDHLILLIGTNPLPNYVAGRLLLNPGGRLYLVHSDATRPTAERLSKYWIDNDQGQRPQFVPVDEADSVNIRSQINSVLTGLTSGKIGLNYTGGTKLMSVHACRTLLDFQTKNRSPVALSYLDARSNRMHIEHGDDALFVSAPILHEITPPLTLEQLVKLHAVKLVSEIERTPRLPTLAGLLADEHQLAEVSAAWRSWCNNTLRPITRTEDQSSWAKEGPLRSVQLPLPTEQCLDRVIKGFRTKFDIEQQTQIIPLATASERAGFRKIKHFCEWLDGKWLEYYVLHILQAIATDKPECRIQDCGMGIKPKNEPDSVEYDIDIGVMQGYRLYAISCTTDDENGLCKLKLFEAYERARNMGGDEARVGLICLNNNPKALERQVGRSWDAADKVRVFGRSDIPDLADRLSDWFISAGS